MNPCSCGSGKKYKHCCLPGYAPSIEYLWARQDEESARLTREMVRIEEAWQDFNLNLPPPPLEPLPEERQIFMPYFLRTKAR